MSLKEGTLTVMSCMHMKVQEWLKQEPSHREREGRGEREDVRERERHVITAPEDCCLKRYSSPQYITWDWRGRGRNSGNERGMKKRER